MAARHSLKAFLRDERGATAVEYGLIAVLIVVAAITGLTSFGNATTGLMAQIGAAVDAAIN